MTEPTHDTEARLVDALRDHPAPVPDLDRLSSHAVRGGTRLRRRRQGSVVVAAVALVAVGSFGVAALSSGGESSSVPFAGTSDPVATETPTTPPPPVVDPSPVTPSTPAPPAPSGPEGAYAFLDVPGWVTGDDPPLQDEKLYYAGPDGQSVSLNWRPADTYDDKWAYPDAPRTAVIDGDPAALVSEGGGYLVVGPVRAGRFLTLSTSAGVDRETILELAAAVHRQ